MPLRACMEAHTHREYLTWMQYLDNQWNQPSRSDHYLMQLAAEVHRVPYAFGKKNSKVQTKDKQIKFITPTRKPKQPLSQERIDEITRQAKARWRTRTQPSSGK